MTKSDEQHEDTPEMVIDTSKMSEGKRDALELAEHSREHFDQKESYVASLFMGKFRPQSMFPFPKQSEEDHVAGENFVKQLRAYLRDNVDANEIDRTGEIPDEVIRGFADMGAFGIKIEKDYGGLGLSQTNYAKAAVALGSHCGSTTALLSAHQSIGVPQPLKLFGTEAQKKKYLPRVAKGEISAFALTEPGVGSDPARMQTTAEPTEDGSAFILNGEKLWCTNGTKAGVIIVMARTPAKMIRGKERNQITAFLLEMDAPGVEIVRRCHFLGLRALYNAVIHFKEVRIPAENIIGGEGKGLKVALSTLNTGRLTVPAACAGLSKKCLQTMREWSAERVQWGAPIGHHQAISAKIAKVAANIYATESMVLYSSALVDRKVGDIRLEAAIAKMWGTERAWEDVDECMQVRGGRGYETYASQKARGDTAVPVERWMRDARINTIFEGSSEIMRLFIAREALDPHLKTGGKVMNSKLPMGERLKAVVHATGFYARWYPSLWMPGWLFASTGGVPGPLKKHVRYVARTSKKLARTMFHQMAKYGPKLESEQVILGHLVDIGATLFAMSVATARVANDKDPHAAELVDFFCRESRLAIKGHFAAIRKNNNRRGDKLTRKVLENELTWLEDGVV